MSRIILAEDDDIAARIAVDALMTAGHAVAHFPDGKQALAAIRFRLPHLLILDCEMPVLNGIDTLRMIRQDPDLFGVAIMMLTARTGPGDEDIARYEGAHAYLGKPFDPDELVVHAEALIENFQAREARASFTHYGRGGLDEDDDKGRIAARI